MSAGACESTETLSALLAGARSRLGWSLRDAERATGVPNAHLSQIETGTIRRPSFVILANLATAYGIPLRRLADASGQGSDLDAIITALNLPVTKP